MTSQKSGPIFGQRHVLAVLSGLGLAILFCIRVSLSVTMVAMVFRNESERISSNGSRPSSLDGDCGSNGLENLTATLEEHSSLPGEFNWSRRLQGLILSSFFWGYLVLQIPAGNIAQRYGAKWCMGGSIIWLAVLSLLQPICARTSPYLMMAVCVLQGLGSSVSFSSVLAMLGRWVPPEENSRLMIIALSGPFVGTVTGHVLAGFVCSSKVLGGWPSVFYINGTVGFIWSAVWWYSVSSSPDSHPRITEEERAFITKSIGIDQKAANREGIPWRQMLLSREIWLYVTLSFVMGWISYSMMICLPQFLADVLHVSLTVNGVLSTLPSLSQAFTSNLSAHLADFIILRSYLSRIATRKLFTAIGFWGSSLCFLVIIFSGCNTALILASLAVGYAFFGAIYAGYSTMPLDVCPEFAGTMFAIGNCFTTVSGISVPILIDLLTSDGGSRQSWMRVFYLSIGLSFAAGSLYVLFGTAHRHRWNSSNYQKTKASECEATEKLKPETV